MPAGRPGAGPTIARKLDATPLARQRLEAILKTVAGQATIDEASAELGICTARFYLIRTQALQAAAERLEPRPGGRPRKQTSPEAERIRELEAELERTRRELLAAEVRSQTAQLLPRPQPRSAKKKKRRVRPLRPKRQRRQRVR